MVSFTYIFVSRQLECLTSGLAAWPFLKFTLLLSFLWLPSPSLLTHSDAHTGAQKSWGSITAGGLGDILIPYY